MDRRSAVVIVVVALVGAACVRSVPRPSRDDPGLGEIVLNGAEIPVLWSDGDSFIFLTGPRAGLETRLQGFNALESYGPVHRWGDWTREELFDVAMESRDLSASRVWTCRARGGKDSYDRLLVECPDLRAAQLTAGLGHLYPFDRDPDPDELALQTEARMDERGMWAKGRAEVVLTSVKPAEPGGSSGDWFVNGRTGESGRRGHTDSYKICEEVCLKPIRGRGSCLVYVPYERRYEDKPSCLLPGGRVIKARSGGL